MTKQATALAALARRVRLLPSPANPLQGRRRPAPVLPENIICFQRRRTAELDHPQEGRALHHRHVLIVPLRGRATVCIDDQEFGLRPGTGVVILPYQFHNYKAGGDRSILWLFVTFEFPHGVSLDTLRGVPFAITAEMAGQLDLLLRESAGLPELRLALMLSLLQRPKGGEAAQAQVGARDRMLRDKVNHAVQARRPRIPTARELAVEIGVSPSHLRARFRASCGVSLGRHLRMLRLERACGFLRNGSARISEVAEQCGYPTVYSFSRAFRAVYDESPREYRRGFVDR
jgi:AraC-like DNA-binding protein